MGMELAGAIALASASRATLSLFSSSDLRFVAGICVLISRPLAASSFCLFIFSSATPADSLPAILPLGQFIALHAQISRGCQ